ncbi:ParB/RepB/Spo0J family partition protein [Kitasatospora sp. NPDC087315]|uniref:ParB/RepB/Spo0J family partition protein n=1 Tax=Kitasatospora sp. NPDC087315 TaxID=3364069 RepID=UPI0038080BAF
MGAGASGPGGTFRRTKKSMWGEASEIQDIPLDDLIPNPFNPRKLYEHDKITELADSIRAGKQEDDGESGLLQVIVTAPADEFFEYWNDRLSERPRELEKLTTAEAAITGDLAQKVVILMGHRRSLALREVGEEFAPCQVKAPLIKRARILGLPENMQRVNLNPIEEAEAYQALLDDGLDQNAVAKEVGRRQAHISRRVSLLFLPYEVQEAVARGELNATNADTLRTKLKHTDVKVWQRDIVKAWNLMKGEDGLKVGAAVARVLADRDTRSADPNEKPARQSQQPHRPASLPSPRDENKTSQGAPENESTPPERPNTHPPTGQSPAAQNEKRHDQEQLDHGTLTEQPAAEPTLEEDAAARRDETCRVIVAAGDLDNPRQTIRLMTPALLDPTSYAALERAHQWLRDHIAGPDIDDPIPYLAAVLDSGSGTLTTRAALAVALAAAEIRVSAPHRTWDARDRAHLEFLRENGYRFTDWEHGRLGVTA